MPKHSWIHCNNSHGMVVLIDEDRTKVLATMDSSKIVEDKAECGSNVSGWTTYIASPEHDDDDEEEDEDHTIDRKADARDSGDGESDDSMASDASSGPSLQELSSGKFEGSHAENKDHRRWFGKKCHPQEEKKQYDEQIKTAKKKPGQKANGAGRSKKK
ncbi:unnamed protein product [Fraxinus pennsylvanica]|uniref:Uncharacterized protein n=1 Tax=Fraxinus pennsylvanica TaxID=56036 RepID=A0AAD1ZE24_9LAMI|nr:unnamed protein product [Fraxinus pennsylvanica]